MLQSVIDDSNRCTVLAVSNDPLVMASCDRVVVLEDGNIVDHGHFDELLNRGSIKNYIE